MSGYDLHTHLAPRPDALGEVPGVGRTDAGTLRVDGHPVGPPDLYRPDRLVEYLDRAGLDTAVVSLPPPFFRQHLPAGEAAAWVRAATTGLLAATSASERLAPLAYLPLEHPEVALAEYRRIRDDERFAGVAGSACGRSLSLADARFEPLWEQLATDERLLMLHPGEALDSRLSEFYLANLLGNPAETGVAAAQLVFGGVLARHPALKILLVHCGGIVPALAGRWQRGADTTRPGVPAGIEAPAKAVRRFHVDCLAHDAAVVDLAVSVFGEDRIVLGSDWPFPMGSPDPASLLVHRGEDFVRRAAVDNARALLGGG